MPELLANNFSTTVAGSATGTGVGSKQVASTTGLTAGITYRFLIESEIALGILVDSTHINLVVRGAEGTTAVDHATSTTITNILTAAGARMTVLDPYLDYLELKDDFTRQDGGGSQRGELNWILTTNGTGYTEVHTSATNHPGIIRVHTEATQDITMALALGVDGKSLWSADLFDVRFILALGQTGAGIQMRMGITDDHSGTGEQNGFLIEKLTGDTNWFYKRLAITVATRTDSSIAVDTSYHRFRIRRIDASTIGFSIDGVETTTTTGAPTGSTFTPMLSIKNPSTAADKYFDFDLFKLIVTGLSR